MQFKTASEWINGEWAACYKRSPIEEKGRFIAEDPIRFTCGRARGMIVGACMTPNGPTTEALIERLKHHKTLLAQMNKAPAWVYTASRYCDFIIRTLGYDDNVIVNHTQKCRAYDMSILAAQAAWEVAYPKGCRTCGATGFVEDSDPDVGMYGSDFCGSCAYKGICPECGELGINVEDEDEPKCPHCGIVLVEEQRKNVLPYPGYDYCDC